MGEKKTDDAGGVLIPIGSTLSHAEQLVITATLRHHRGNMELAAGTLRISLKTLYNRRRDYGITDADLIEMKFAAPNGDPLPATSSSDTETTGALTPEARAEVVRLIEERIKGIVDVLKAAYARR
jgi:hypothetical protein